MSFILDALKKSENERQRTMGPSLADAPARRVRDERPWWAYAVAALLIINLGVLIVVLVRDKSAPANPATSIAPQPAPSVPAPAVTPESAQPAIMPAQPVPITPSAAATRAPNPAVRSLADEAGTPAGQAVGNVDPQMHAALEAAAAAPQGPPMVRPIQPPTVTALPADPTYRSVAAPGAARSSQEVLPTAGDLAASGTTLPELKLDIHVYSKNPAERFVFVNMRKYLEGQTLQEGPVLEKITTDGVVLNQHGLRYALPRQ